jgi:hypothetical protein
MPRRGGKRELSERGLGSGDLYSLLPEPVASGPWPPAEQSRARHLEALRRQLQVELKVKQGAENMIHTCASGTPKVRFLGSDGGGTALAFSLMGETWLLDAGGI